MDLEYKGPEGYDNKNRFEKGTPVTSMSYRDTAAPYYKNYPGGFEGKRKEALAYRKKNNNNNFDTTGSIALAPRLQDDWVMDRKNPVYLSSADFEKDTPNRRTMGISWVDAMRDGDGKKYSVSDMFPTGVNPRNPPDPRDGPFLLKGQIKRGMSPWDALVEENTHGAQPPDGFSYRDKKGYFGEPNSIMPYAARNGELGAKLTNEAHTYIRSRWAGEKHDRKDSFNEKDAASILKRLYKDKYSKDDGLQNFIRTEKGRKYLEENKEELIKFLMSTAQVDPKAQPGMFTGQNPMVESYA